VRNPHLGLRVATRGSRLALAQARIAGDALRRAGAGDVRDVVVRTTADRHPDTPLERLEGQGWFVAEVERTLLDGEADVAVHSAKDLPADLADGLCVAALLPRADPRDAVVSRDGLRLADLPAGARVGTSSVRRIEFLRILYPHLVPTPVRGNVDTRLAKLDAGVVDAMLLASAGLDRIGAGDRAAERLDPTWFVPAPAQGAIALEARCGSPVAALCSTFDDGDTRCAVTAERAVLATIGGGCVIPLGAWARTSEGGLAVSAALATEARVVRAELVGDPAAPEELGVAVASHLQ